MANRETDVYIVYSREDREVAERLADRLRSSGFSVWWDQQLTTGDNFQTQIFNQLRSAKAVIALFTPHSVWLRWTRTEAMIAFEQDTLIPIVIGEVNLPAPFSSLHSVSLDARLQPEDAYRDLTRAIRMRVEEQSFKAAKRGATSGRQSSYADAAPSARQTEAGAPKSAPREESPRRSRAISVSSLRELQIQTMYWFGVGGAIVTLVGNLETFLKLAKWVKFAFANWAAILTFIWNAIIPFDLEVLAEDAVILTLLAILFFNLLVTSRSKDLDIRARTPDYLLLIPCLLAVMYLGFLGFLDEVDPLRVGLVDQAMAPALSALHALAPPSVDQAASFLGMSVAGLLLMAIAYVPLAIAFAMRPNVNAFAIRLFRILIGVAIVALVNQISLAIEAQDWGAALQTAGMVVSARGG